MLLAFASLGAGMASAEQNEQTVNLEDLGILEVTINEDGVVDVVITKEAFYSFLGVDLEFTNDEVPAIEEIVVELSLDDDGKLVIENLEYNLAENQPDEIVITLLLSEELLEILEEENPEELMDWVVDLTDLMLDSEVEDDYFGSRIYWADMAYQLRGCQGDYDHVMESEDPEGAFYTLAEELVENIDERVQWADLAYQLRGEQDDYDRVMHADSPEDEFYAIYDEMVEDDESEEEVFEDWNESEEEDVEDWAELGYSIDMRDGDVSQIVVIVNTDGEIADVTVIVIYEDGEYDMFEVTMMLEDLRERLVNFDGIVVWNWVPTTTPPMEDICERGRIAGAFNVFENGSGEVRGQVMDDEGNIIGQMWGVFNEDGFIHGFGGANHTADAQWKAVAEDGRFTGLWNMLDSDEEGVLKGYYELNETGDSGVFRGKWKMQNCLDDRADTPDEDREFEPRLMPIRVDEDRDLVKPMVKPNKDKPMADKVSDVMDKPLVETEGGAIIDVGDAAAGSTLGTIALLGAGFIRRRVTGGL